MMKTHLPRRRRKIADARVELADDLVVDRAHVERPSSRVDRALDDRGRAMNRLRERQQL